MTLHEDPQGIDHEVKSLRAPLLSFRDRSGPTARLAHASLAAGPQGHGVSMSWDCTASTLNWIASLVVG